MLKRQKEPARSEWIDALVGALRRLEKTGPAPLFFLEEREDLRVEIGSGHGPRVVRTRLAGLSSRTGVGPYRYRYRSAPGPADAETLAAGRFQDGASAPADGEPWLDERGAIERLESLAAGVREAAGTQKLSFAARYVGFRQEVLVVRSGTRPASDRRQGERIRLEVTVRRDAAEGVAAADRVLRASDPETLVTLAGRVVERAAERLDAKAATPGKRPVVFAPGVGGILIHELVGHALEGDTLRRGATPLMLSKPPVAATALRVVDDPRRGRAAWRVDDEGEPARPTPLIHEGRVAGCLHDLRSARHAGRPTTGHARRSSYREPVRPRMGCTFVAAGVSTPEEILAEAGTGIYVRAMEAAVVDPVSGRATFRVTDADEIVDGRRAWPCRPFLLRVDTAEMLPRLAGIGSDLAFDTCIGTCLRDGQPLATSVGAPTIGVGVATVLL